MLSDSAKLSLALQFLPVLLCTTVSILSVLFNDIVFHLLTLASIALHLLALLSLSFAATQYAKASEQSGAKPERNTKALTLIVRTTQINGILASLCLLFLPFCFPTENPLAHCILRVVCFFYAFKLLDLTTVGASHPPKLIEHGRMVPIKDWPTRSRYVYLLLTECRYHSFDIAVVEKGRNSQQSPSTTWTYLPAFLTLVLASCIPTAETLFLLTLSAIHLGLETAHTILHRTCPHPLFYQPFAANSITTFWSVHWHQAARPFLSTVGYRPAKNLFASLLGNEVGSAMGVIATFSLSGIWHGWAAAALVEQPWTMGCWLWAIFVGHGLACVGERVLQRKGIGGGIGQGVLTWVLAVGTVAMWMRAGLGRLKIDVPLLESVR